MWPFAKQLRFPGVKQNNDGTIDFTLTDEEARAADCALHAFKGTLVHPEIADKVRNGTIAVALSRYAKDEVSTNCVGITGSELKTRWPTIRKTLETAIASVWKSYSLCPLPVFVYHRASFFQMLGIRADARKLFASFLKMQSDFKMDQVDKSLLAYEGTRIESALSHARQEI